MGVHLPQQFGEASLNRSIPSTELVLVGNATAQLAAEGPGHMEFDSHLVTNSNAASAVERSGGLRR